MEERERKDFSVLSKSGIVKLAAIVVFMAGLVGGFGSTASALPTLQLWIDPGTNGSYYDTKTETWVWVAGSSFTLTVVGAKQNGVNGVSFLDDVIISAALPPGVAKPSAAVKITQVANPSPFIPPLVKSPDLGIQVRTSPADFVFGTPPIPGADLPPHAWFPTWFTTFNAGDFDLTLGNVFQTQFTAPDYLDTSNPKKGLAKTFRLDLQGSFPALHFDAYTLKPDGSIQYFAPFSHDAEMIIPEPSSFWLLGVSLVSLGGLGFRRRSLFS